MYCVSSSIFFMHCITLSMVYWLFSSDMFSIFSVLILSSILYPSVSVYSCASSEGRSVILFSSVNRALPFLTRPFARFSYVLPIIFPLESTTSIFSEAGEVLFVMGTLPYSVISAAVFCYGCLPRAYFHYIIPYSACQAVFCCVV